MTTIGVLVKAPGFIVFGALLLLLILAKGALADGAYQRTDDRKKTLVWNNNPKPDDTATWSGGRDAEGYATVHASVVPNGPKFHHWFECFLAQKNTHQQLFRDDGAREIQRRCHDGRSWNNVSRDVCRWS